MFKKTVIFYDVSTLPINKTIEDVIKEIKKDNLCTYNTSNPVPGQRQIPYAIQVTCTFKEWIKLIFK